MKVPLFESPAMNVSFPSLAQFRKWRAEKKLGEAIANRDLDQIRQYLDQGARQIDYILMRDGDRPGERIPAGKFTDPVALAKYVGIKDNDLRMFEQHGLMPKVAGQEGPVKAAGPAGPR